MPENNTMMRECNSGVETSAKGINPEFRTSVGHPDWDRRGCCPPPVFHPQAQVAYAPLEMFHPGAQHLEAQKLRFWRP